MGECWCAWGGLKGHVGLVASAERRSPPLSLCAGSLCRAFVSLRRLAPRPAGPPNLAGVPCLTLAGSCHAHNVGVSLLTAVGLQQDWVAHSGGWWHACWARGCWVGLEGDWVAHSGGCWRACLAKGCRVIGSLLAGPLTLRAARLLGMHVPLSAGHAQRQHMWCAVAVRPWQRPWERQAHWRAGRRAWCTGLCCRSRLAAHTTCRSCQASRNPSIWSCQTTHGPAAVSLLV